ncbi:replication initiation protein [Shewanella sp.]|uniref:replication initiation protein n=1 Tax=Shewanella sp. TaxID=50422 RepID=UPI003A969735|nr:replication initiation protein [Salmonella enterica subsp. enterica serovar Montevideo]
MKVAVSTADSGRYFQQGTALHRILSEAPYLPRCSDNKTAARIRPREYAIRYPYMQVNRPGMVSWLVFDLDHSNPLIWEDEGLPAPNIIVSNRKNGHPHLYYAIPPVCTTENARSKPIAFMKAVYEAMAARLCADPSYSGPVAKTPGHPWWNTWEIHHSIYDLGELADYVDLAVKPLWSSGPNLDAVAHSRHCLLFEELRFYAYSIVNREREQGNFGSFNRLLEAYAFNKNNFRLRGFDMNLTAAQVKATVKSVARWTWDRYTGSSRCHRGMMRLDSSLPLRERQRLSAKRTHEVRQKSTESRIRAACRQLLQQGLKLTQTAIAKLAKLSRQTVAKYRHICNEVSESSTNVISLDEVVMAPKAVKHGVHQIPAPRRGQQESSHLGGDLKSDDAKTRDVHSEDLSTRPVDWPLKE